MKKRILSVFICLFLIIIQSLSAYADAFVLPQIATDNNVNLYDIDELNEVAAGTPVYNEAAAQDLAGAVGYVPFDSAFWAAAGALGVAGAAIAYAVTPDEQAYAQKAAIKAAKEEVNKKGGLETLYNGAQIVKTYVQNGVNYLSKSFLEAVANALNAQGLMQDSAASFSALSSEAIRNVTSADFYNISDAINYFEKILGVNYYKDIFTYLNSNMSILTNALNGLTPTFIVLEDNSYNYIKFSIVAFDSKKTYNDVLFVGTSKINSKNSILEISDMHLVNCYVSIANYPNTFTVTDITSDFFSNTSSASEYFFAGKNYYRWTHAGRTGDYNSFGDLRKFSNYGYSLSKQVPIGDEYDNYLYVTYYGLYKAWKYSSAWSVTSNVPKFGAAALMETMPTWAATTTTIPANTVDSTGEAVEGYPVSIPAGDTAVTDTLSADNVKSLTQDDFQAGAIDTSTDITDLSAVTEAITGAADQTAANFNSLFGWLESILEAIQALPANIFAAFKALLGNIEDVLLDVYNAVKVLPDTIATIPKTIVDAISALGDTILTIPKTLIDAWREAFPAWSAEAAGTAASTETIGIEGVEKWAQSFYEWAISYIKLPDNIFEKVPFCIPYDLYLLLKGMLQTDSAVSVAGVDVSNNPSDINITVDIPIVEREYNTSVEESYAPVFNFDVSYPYHDTNGEQKIMRIQQKADLHKFNYLAQCIKFAIGVSWLIGVFNWIMRIFSEG